MNIVYSSLLRDILVLLTSYICVFFVFIQKSKLYLINTQKALIVVSGIFTPCFCAYLRSISFTYYRFIFVILLIITCMLLDKNNLYLSFSVCVLSIAISYCLELISILLLITPFYLFHYYDTNIFTTLCSSVLQITLTYFFLRLKRIKNGFSFVNDRLSSGITLFACGSIIILLSIQKETISKLSLTFLSIGMFISIIGIFLWIRSAFKRYYRKRLKLRSEEFSKLELAEKDKEIEKLSDENTSLSSIIHLDNQIIQTIETELNKLNNTEPANKLLISISQRNDYVNSVLIKSKNLASTGNAGVDAVLLDLYIKAASRGIDFNLNTDCDINYLINNIITNNDFEALLRELITNSIIAVKNNPKITGRISINISQPNDIYELTVMDNGSFIDNNSIPDTIEKSKASITTNHFENNDSFTKSVTIRFDGLNMNEHIF